MYSRGFLELCMRIVEAIYRGGLSLLKTFCQQHLAPNLGTTPLRSMTWRFWSCILTFNWDGPIYIRTIYKNLLLKVKLTIFHSPTQPKQHHFCPQSSMYSPKSDHESCQLYCLLTELLRPKNEAQWPAWISDVMAASAPSRKRHPKVIWIAF